jgi:O-antigen/teichoic acid export membrane protein
MEGKKFAYDVGWIFSGSTFALILSIITSPVMAYYLGASGLGLWVMLFAITSLLGVTNLGIPGATIKYVAEYKDNKNKLYQVASASFIISIILGIITAVALFITADIITGIFDMPSLTPLFKLFLLTIPFNYMVGSVIATLNGLREMKLVSLLNVTSGSLNFGLILIPIILGYGLKGAVIGLVIATIIYAFIAMFFFRNFIFHLTFSKFRETAKKLLHFGIQTVMSGIVSIILYRIDVLMIGYFMTSTEVGIYSVAIGIARMIWIIPQSINTVSYPTFSYYWGKGEHDVVNKIFDTGLKYSACMLAPIGLGLAIFGKDAILLLYGNTFLPAVLPLQILLIGTVVSGTWRSIGTIFSAVGRVDLGYKIPPLTAIPNILLNYTLIPYYGMLGAAIATTLSFFINLSVSAYLAKRIVRVRYDVTWFSKAIVLTLVMVTSFYICSMFLNDYLAGALLLAVYSGLIYYRLLTKEDRTYLIEVTKPFRSKIYGK